MGRPFYIIGHNPNSVEEAVQYLQKGANALEPDVHWVPEQQCFRVAHSNPSDSDPTLEEYLQKLATALRESRTRSDMHGVRDDQGATHYALNLAMIAFDLKTYEEYDINDLYTVIRMHFSNEFPEIAILTTVGTPDAADFLCGVAGNQRENEYVGIDENATPDKAVALMENRGVNYTFGSGITFFSFEPLDSIIGPKSFVDRLQHATLLRDNLAPVEHDSDEPPVRVERMKYAYAWCINREYDMRCFLDIEPGIDGINTDEVQKLYQLVTTDPAYKEKYTIARVRASA